LVVILSDKFTENLMYKAIFGKKSLKIAKKIVFFGMVFIFSLFYFGTAEAAFGNIEIRATLNGETWDGMTEVGVINYTISGTDFYYSDLKTPLPRIISNALTGSYSAGANFNISVPGFAFPERAYFESITPNPYQNLSDGETIVFTFNIVRSLPLPPSTFTPKPDLTHDMIIGQGPLEIGVLNAESPYSGNTITLVAGVKNQGTVAVITPFRGRFEIDLYSVLNFPTPGVIQPTTTIGFNTADITLISSSVSGLVSDGHTEVSSVWPNLPEGDHVIRFCIDKPDNSIAESDENNNCVERQFTVSSALGTIHVRAKDPAGNSFNGAASYTLTGSEGALPQIDNLIWDYYGVRTGSYTLAYIGNQNGHAYNVSSDWELFSITPSNSQILPFAGSEITFTLNFTTKATTTPVLPQCSDGIDNDNDGKIDENDPACHTDGNLGNNASYNQNTNDENSKPTITLLGNATATTTEGDVYTDAGATAFDDEDGNITSRITVLGDVISTSTPAGTYTILFSVADLKGASASTTRTVIVNSKANDGGGNGTTTLNAVGIINVDAKLDGMLWIGAVNYSLIATSTINATSSPQTFLNQPIGSYTSNYLSGGPVNAIFSSTTPFSTQTLQASSTITFTLNFTTKATTTPVLPQCSDGIDNDNDGKIDENDPACHTDGNLGNNASYNQNTNDENSKPTITLLGNATATTTEGDVYTDAGATAFDDEDGNITSRITVLGDVISTSTPAGTYTILFSVADLKGASASTTRTVIVNSKANDENNNGGGGNTGGNNSGGGGAVGVASANGPVGFSGMPMSFASASNGIVLGVKTEKKQETLIDKCVYLHEYLKFGQKNNPFEVKKLQYFLRTFEGFKTVESTGVFDLKTLKAVRDFQEKYNKNILEPWALPTPTGYVYITTRKKVNEIYCEKEFSLTIEQKREILEFNALMRRLKLGRSINNETVKKEMEKVSGNVEKIDGENVNVSILRNKDSENNFESVLNGATSSLAILLSATTPRELYVNMGGGGREEGAFRNMLFYFFRYKLFIVSFFLFGILALLVYRIFKDVYKNKIE